MRTLFLTSSGLNEKTMVLFWKCIGKEPINTKAILVPSAAVGNDGAREGIIVCMERLMNMGIPMNNILIYNLAFLLSDGYKRTYSSYISDIPVPFRLMSVQELTQYDMIAFCGGNAHTLLSEINRTGFSKPLKQAIENGLVYLGISAGSMIAAGNFSDGLGYLANPLIPVPFRLMSVQELTQYDMIAFCGGNAHTLLSEINRTGFSKPLKQAIENGLVYLGISAGSMIAAGNFSDGLGYLANPLIPHAEKESPFGDISKNDLIELADGQTVLIKGNRQEII